MTLASSGGPVDLKVFFAFSFTKFYKVCLNLLQISDYYFVVHTVDAG